MFYITTEWKTTALLSLLHNIGTIDSYTYTAL